jgi:hypothetical protein
MRVTSVFLARHIHASLVKQKNISAFRIRNPVSAVYCAGHVLRPSLGPESLETGFPVHFLHRYHSFSAARQALLPSLLSSKPFQYLGKISYSIYLNHAIVLIFVNIVLFRFLKSPENEVMFAVSLLSSIGLTILYSHFTYEFVEKRVGKFLRENWR